MFNNEPSPLLDAPIPGQGMTAPLGARPWQNPPQFTTVDQTLKFYIQRLTNDKMTNQIMDLLEAGVPIDTMVDTSELGGVMEGLHTVDVGMLVTPVLAELISNMADAADVEYKLYSTENDESKPTTTQINMAINAGTEAGERISAADIMSASNEVTEEETTEETPEQPKGLMARRVADGI